VERIDASKNLHEPILERDGLGEIYKTKNAKFTKGQKEALNYILTSRESVMGIQGDAGTGKTTMLNALREELESIGIHVKGFAVTNKATEELTKGAGIESQTLYSFFLNKNHNTDKLPENKKSEMWIIDEAGMVGSKGIFKLLKLAEKENARIVLIGDGKQLMPIDAGKMFVLLHEIRFLAR